MPSPANSPVDEPDGGHDNLAQELERNNTTEPDQPIRRPETLYSDSKTDSTEGMTESSTMNGLSPIERDTVDSEYERANLNLHLTESPTSITGSKTSDSSTPGSRVSPDKTIAEKLKKKIRHFSGARTDSLPPPLDSPVTEDKFRYVLPYLMELDLTAIVDYLKNSDLNANETLDEEAGKKASHILCETENASVNVFKALLKCGHRFSIFTKKGFTTLHLAARKFNNEIVKELLNIHPELVNIPDQDGLTPVHVAVAYRNKEAFDLMSSCNADLTVLGANNTISPLHLAIKILHRLSTDSQDNNPEKVHQDIHNMESIIETIVNKSSPEQLHQALMQKFMSGLEENEYPLHLLGRLKQLRVIRSISDKISDPSVYGLKNGDGATPFLACLKDGWQRRVLKQVSMQDSALERTLMDRQETEEKEEEEGMPERKKKRTKSKSKKNTEETPYEVYLSSCRYLLLRMTGDVDASCDPLTPLQMVLYRCQNLTVEKDLVETLLEKGANVLIENDYDSPIEIVLSNNFRRDILRLFIDHLRPETINNQDCNNSTVLHYAVSIGDKDFITKLLEKQADPSIAADCPDFSDVDFYNNPNAKRPINTVKKTPLVLSLTHGTVEVYFEALRKADISEVIQHITDSQLLLFFQNHLTAAACFSAKEVVRDLSMLLSNKSIIRRISCASYVTEEAVVGEVIHYLDETHPDRTFHKTGLAWANENDDPISASDLIHLEYRHHTDKDQGICCIKKQLTNDRLLFWIVRTFTRFYPSVSFKKWCQAIFVSLLQLGVSYSFFIFDIVSDYQLTRDYYTAYTNTSNYSYQMLQCARVGNQSVRNSSASCFSFAEEFPDKHYYVAMCLTYLSMFLSIGVYFIGIFFFFDVSNITENFRKKREETEDEDEDENKKSFSKKISQLWYFLEHLLLTIIVKLFWPLFHLYRKIRYEATKNKSSRREKLIEFDGIWFMVKTIEYGIEATIQLKIVLYLLIPYYDEIHEWDFQTTMQKVADGLLHFLTAGRFEACLLDKVIGKLAFNVFSQTMSLTLLKYLKYGMSPLEQVSNILPLFVSYFLQILARVKVIRVFFVTAEDLFGLEDKGLAIGLFFLIHFLLVLVIKLIFEVGGVPRLRCERESMFQALKFWLRFLINWVSSSFVYVWSTGYGSKARDNIHEHNTALPQILFQLLILVEHLVLVIYPVTLVAMDCLDRHTYVKTAWEVPVMWVGSNFLLVLHYSSCHTWSATNGPRREGGSLTCHQFCCLSQYRLTWDLKPPLLHWEKTENYSRNSIREDNLELTDLLLKT